MRINEIILEAKKKKAKKKPKPTSPQKWASAKAKARSKFDVYPSAYANAWAAKEYKRMGGGWRMNENTEWEIDEPSKLEQIAREFRFVLDPKLQPGWYLSTNKSLRAIDVAEFGEYYLGERSLKPGQVAFSIEDSDKHYRLFKILPDDETQINLIAKISDDEIEPVDFEVEKHSPDPESAIRIDERKAGKHHLEHLVKAWFNNPLDRDDIESDLANHDLEIGELEDGGVYIVKSGDITGKSMKTWSPDELESSEISETAYKGGLKKWFRERWVNLAKPKKGGGYEACGTSGEKRGYAKCVPANKASKMSSKDKKSAVNRKRSAQRKAGRAGKSSGSKGQTPIYVKTKKD